MAAIKHYPKIPFRKEPTDEFLLARLEWVVQSGRLNLQGGPGYPFGLEYASNGAVVRDNYCELMGLSLDLVKSWRDTPHSLVRAMSPSQIFANKLYWPFRVMVKDEPHSEAKMKEGRFRPICAESLQTTIVFAAVLGELVDTEIENWATIDSKPGMGLDDEGLVKIWDYSQSLIKKYGPLMCSDVSGWDWSVGSTLIDMLSDTIVLQTESTFTLWENIIRNMLYCQMSSLLATSDGVLYELIRVGGVRSGGYLTACGNSKMRKMLTVAKFVISGESAPNGALTMGDDCAETLLRSVAYTTELYRMMGFKLTDQKVCQLGDPIEFCSHLITESGGVPQSWARTFFRLLSKDKTEEEYSAWQYEMRGLSGPLAMVKLEDLEYFLRWARWHSTADQAQNSTGVELKRRLITLNMTGTDKKKVEVVTVRQGGTKKKVSVPVNKKGEVKVRSGGIKATSAKARAPDVRMQNYVKELSVSNRQAAKLAYLAMVAHPFGDVAVALPRSLAPGCSQSVPRIFEIVLRGVIKANASGFCCVGANADAWYARGNEVGEVPIPQYQYLGNKAAFGGNRGYPVHFTTTGWLGNPATGGTGLSYPSSGSNAGAGGFSPGQGFAQLPDDFIYGQTDNNPVSYNANQRYQNLCVGLRVRPVSAPLNTSGEVGMFQQLFGEGTTQTWPTVYAGALLSGVDVFTSMMSLNPEMIGRQTVALANWPSGKWLHAAAIPNTATCFGQWAGGNVGNKSVGAPQLAAIVSGAAVDQAFEWEAAYKYAFFGVNSYEAVPDSPAMPAINPGEVSAAVSSGHIAPLMTTATSKAPAQQGAKAWLNFEKDDTPFTASNIVGAVKGASSAFEEFTGMSVIEALGEGLGFLAAVL